MADYVGLGPFVLSEYVSGSHLLARANPTYALGRPKIDEVEVRFIPDPNTIAANLLAGSVDLTLNNRIAIDWGVQLRDRWTDGHLEPVYAGNWLAMYPQFLDPNPALLLDLRFREALTRAIDRQELSDTLLASMSSVAHGLIEPNQPECGAVAASVVKYDYDPRRAVQILDGIGLSKGPDGLYRDLAGQPLAVELRTRAGNDLEEKALASTSDYWKQAGIGSTQLIFGAQQANDRAFRSLHPAYEVTRQPDGADGLARFVSSEIPTAANNFLGLNRMRYANSELDGLISKFFTTIPVDQRNQYLAQAVNVISREMVVLSIAYVVDSGMIANRVTGVTARIPAWNAHEWDVR